MTIGGLAKATGTQVVTIRFYERVGLLPEGGRTDSNYRLYVEEDVNRLTFIRRCRLLDMSLDTIRILLRFRDKRRKSRDTSKLLASCVESVAHKINELERLQAELKELEACS